MSRVPRPLAVACLLLVCACPVFAIPQSVGGADAPPPIPATSAAGQLAAAAGIKAGVCVFPRVDDPARAFEFASLPGFLVHGQREAEDQVLALRQEAASRGMLARSFVVVQGGPRRLAVADRFAELVVLDKPQAGDLTPELREECVRALIPARGRLLVRAASGGPDEKALRAWLGKEAEPAPVKVGGETWVALRRPALPGSDLWSHRNHDPANSRLSPDASVKPPFLTQWWGLPIHEGFWGTTVVAGNGRAHTLWMGGWPQVRYAMVTRSLANGTPLWERGFAWDPPRDRLSGGYYPGRSCVALEGDHLYLMLETAVERLDAETGATTGKIEGPAPSGQLKWLALENGLLAVMAGETDLYKSSSLQNQLLNPHGRTLAVYDARAGDKPLWQEVEQGDIDDGEIVVRDGKLFYHAKGARVAARDLRTGTLLWENRDAQVLELLSNRVERAGDKLISVPTLTAAPEALFFSAVWLANQVALDLSTGALLWSQPAPKGGRVLHSLVMGGKVHLSTGVLDLKTGQQISADKLPTSGCGPTKAVPGMFITTFGSCFAVDGLQPIRATDVKGPCDIGPIVADGWVLNPSGRCRCNLEMQGYRVFRGAGDFDPHAAPNKEGRLVKGPAFAAKPAAAASDTSDWPTYRHDARRSGATPAAVGAVAPAQRWHFQAPKPQVAPHGPFGRSHEARFEADPIPTQPVAAAGRILQGGADGVIRCFEASSGKALWSYPVGFKLFAPPAIAGGMVYAGAADGWVYCLRLDDGKLAWRFLAAPAERQITWYGQPANTWPLCGGVLLHDGTVYAVAGYQDHNGIHAWALDAATGAVKWSNHAAGKDVNTAMSSFGHLAIAAGRLWVSSASTFPGSFDLATGEALALPGEQFMGSPRRGMEIGALDDRWIVFGGRRISHPTTDLWLEREKSTGVSFVRADARIVEGQQLCFGVEALDDAEILPASDGKLTVAVQAIIPRSGRESRLLAWPTTSLIAELEATQEPKPQHLGRRSPYYLAQLGGRGEKPAEPATPTAWPPAALNAIALALAADAALIAHAPADEPKNKFPSRGQISAVDRGTGEIRWTVDLPSVPVFEGLSVDRDGRILVSLLDGGLVCFGGKN